MQTKLLGLAAVTGIIALSGTIPANALCNPGSPNCIRDDNIELQKAKNQVNQGKNNFNCDPDPVGVCSNDLPGDNLPASGRARK